MSVADTIINEISKEISELRTGPYGEVIFDDALFIDLPDPEYFLHPEPDVLAGPPRPPDERVQAELDEHPRLLGVYIPMRSPGQIILIRRNLRWFFWSLVSQLHHRLPYLTPIDLQGALRLVVSQTYQHELFHFHSDVLRQLFGGRFDPLLEEALAVAWSRSSLVDAHGNSKIARLNRVFFNRLLEAAFDFRSPGYRDWPHYADARRFKTALLDYLDPPNYRRLQTNGIENLDDLVFSMVGQISGGAIEVVA